MARAAAGRAGLTVEAVRGAVCHPPSATIARLTTPVDAWLGRHTTLGAAFTALATRRPE